MRANRGKTTEIQRKKIMEKVTGEQERKERKQLGNFLSLNIDCISKVYQCTESCTHFNNFSVTFHESQFV